MAVLPAAVSLALLSSPSLPESALAPARHFALHSLQHLITHSWNQLADAEKEYLKSQAISIVQNCSQLCGGVRFLKQTIARIVTEIALREWPQRWPNMLDVLFASCGAQVGVAAGATVTPAAGSDPAGTELLSLVLRNLSEEVTGGESSGVSSLPDQRRRDVQAGLMACMEQIFPWMTGALRSAVATFAANKQDAQALRNCRALLEALYAMMEFLPAKSVDHRLLREARPKCKVCCCYSAPAPYVLHLTLFVRSAFSCSPFLFIFSQVVV